MKAAELLKRFAMVMVMAAGVVQTTTAQAVAKSVCVPARWTQTGEVPRAAERTRESTNFILLWGERSGANPASAPSPCNFDPNSVITQLEKPVLVLREHDAVHTGDRAPRATQDHWPARSPRRAGSGWRFARPTLCLPKTPSVLVKPCGGIR
ncbi:DUF6055 domain-containing protein [Umezawaea sp.]|uniref:DUF6055 domain-containing protein n=1 Tax=Umezawaea sp. TaxID=1955258 RepID=UPI002ED32ABB